MLAFSITVRCLAIVIFLFLVTGCGLLISKFIKEKCYGPGPGHTSKEDCVFRIKVEKIEGGRVIGSIAPDVPGLNLAAWHHRLPVSAQLTPAPDSAPPAPGIYNFIRRAGNVQLEIITPEIERELNKKYVEPYIGTSEKEVR